ncbi:MAG TPA: hypothetical protein VF292_06205 [Rhodanobacteraceae bacterium]
MNTPSFARQGRITHFRRKGVDGQRRGDAGSMRKALQSSHSEAARAARMGPGIHFASAASGTWIPACAGMTAEKDGGIQMFGYYLQLAWRSLRRSPVLSALMVLAIGLGIGASMTTLTVVATRSV